MEDTSHTGLIKDLFQFVPIAKDRIELRLNGEVEGVFTDNDGVMAYLTSWYSPDEKTPFALNIEYEEIGDGRVKPIINGKSLREFPNKSAADRFICRHHLRPPLKRAAKAEPQVQQTH